MKTHYLNFIRYLFALLVLSIVISCDSHSGSEQKKAVVSPPNAQQQIQQSPQNSTGVDAGNVVQDTNQKVQAVEPLPNISSASKQDDGYQEIEWDDLVPEEYRPEVVFSKYMEQLEGLDDSDPKAMQIYGQIEAELENAPINEALNGKKVKLAGFIAPLENSDGKVSEFLLVPYFGACIHVPPPPVNQTVLVKTTQKSAIAAEDASMPFWIKGRLVPEHKSTDIGSAGYKIEHASTEVFE